MENHFLVFVLKIILIRCEITENQEALNSYSIVVPYLSSIRSRDLEYNRTCDCVVSWRAQDLHFQP